MLDVFYNVKKHFFWIKYTFCLVVLKKEVSLQSKNDLTLSFPPR